MSESDPIPNNILLNPLAELTAAIYANSWGIQPTRTTIFEDSAFPRTPAEVDEVKNSSLREGKTDARVEAKARIGLLGREEEWVDVILDQRGYTVINTASRRPPDLTLTFESLEALLIALSPAYVAAMTLELTRKFDQEDIRPRAAWREDEDD